MSDSRLVIKFKDGTENIFEFFSGTANQYKISRFSQFISVIASIDSETAPTTDSNYIRSIYDFIEVNASKIASFDHVIKSKISNIILDDKTFVNYNVENTRDLGECQERLSISRNV